MLQRLTVSFLALVLATAAVAQERDRAKTPDQYKWDLTPLYASDDAWRAAKDAFAAKIPEAAKFKGTLGQSSKQLLLKDAGVDMTTSQPLELTMKKMNRVMDEMDALLKKMGK